MCETWIKSKWLIIIYDESQWNWHPNCSMLYVIQHNNLSIKYLGKSTVFLSFNEPFSFYWLIYFEKKTQISIFDIYLPIKIIMNTIVFSMFYVSVSKSFVDLIGILLFIIVNNPSLLKRNKKRFKTRWVFCVSDYIVFFFVSLSLSPPRCVFLVWRVSNKVYERKERRKMLDLLKFQE